MVARRQIMDQKRRAHEAIEGESYDDSRIDRLVSGQAKCEEDEKFDQAED